ncbi:N-alpha-acetyltransferase 30 [Boothiomyces macroporosus]|uniref:N-alpha-acetyltransferase 30 n=1 Tax=Boothiomyces macroporosus TaxID=261099 RepID=A0AAD5UII4_9FUNG|nr:N-alpha-acetyltransferase 30 [Boothiomyces macroporosus]
MEEFSVVKVQDESELKEIMELVEKDLSEPYTIYTYRYFLNNSPGLSFTIRKGKLIGAIVCKLEPHGNTPKRGYIAMLAVDKEYRNKGIATKLVKRCIEEMISRDADEIVLEAEISNQGALKLYEKLGFVRDKRLNRYYLNGKDAFRLKLWLK